jgi:hypothetical protein
MAELCNNTEKELLMAAETTSDLADIERLTKDFFEKKKQGG